MVLLLNIFQITRAPSIKYFRLFTPLEHVVDASAYSTDTMPTASIVPRPKTDINAKSYDVGLDDPTLQDAALISVLGRGPMLAVYSGASARWSNEVTDL